VTMHKAHQFIAFSCDQCTEDVETGETDFQEALRSARKLGWAPFKARGGVWEHLCPSCNRGSER
jgi:hypothetical protein